jgi:hypothetical protein
MRTSQNTPETISTIGIDVGKNVPFPARPSNMNPRTRYRILHWLDALTWPASLVLKGIRATARTLGRGLGDVLNHDRHGRGNHEQGHK